MYFDFEDHRPDIEPVGSAISTREGALLSMVLHAAFVLMLIVLPSVLPAPDPRALAEQQLALQQARQRELERERESERFVFVAPRRDVEALQAPPRADLSDKDREARSPRRAQKPTNPLPFSRGNSSERVEAQPAPRPRPERRPEPSQYADDAARSESGRQAGSQAPPVAESDRTALMRPPPAVAPGEGGRAAAPGTALGDALRNLQRYVDQESFDNPEGGAGVGGPWIQFDTKGVEFGPWIRRFVAQIKRNWFIPYAAMVLKGHVVLTFNVHKNGAISELSVHAPSEVDAFNHAAFNALAASNPTQPLPPEYPADKAFFTVTFFYNETPP
jgi:TonB family protein